MASKASEWDSWINSPDRKVLLGEWKNTTDVRIPIFLQHAETLFKFLESHSGYETVPEQAQRLWALTDELDRIQLRRKLRLYRNDLVHCRPRTLEEITTRSLLEIAQQDQSGLNKRTLEHENLYMKYTTFREDVVSVITQLAADFKVIGEDSPRTIEGGQLVLLTFVRNQWTSGKYHARKAAGSGPVVLSYSEPNPWEGYEPPKVDHTREALERIADAAEQTARIASLQWIWQDNQ